jgi:hypothetical protein
VLSLQFPAMVIGRDNPLQPTSSVRTTSQPTLMRPTWVMGTETDSCRGAARASTDATASPKIG